MWCQETHLSMSWPVHLPYCLMMDTMEKGCSPGMAVKGCHCSGDMPLLLTYTSCRKRRRDAVHPSQ